MKAPKGALVVFGLDGKTRQTVAGLDRPNNVDIEYGLRVAGQDIDIAVATALVYLTGGFASNFSLTFYVVVIASSLRFGIKGSLLCATIISVSN